ncbi:MAG: putative integral rane efflux protein [Actinomycetia bacterium]|nr:putative integral rane efflux protein [Actinomycetes bacterium]
MTVEQATPPPAPLPTTDAEQEGTIGPDPRRWVILGVLCLALLMVGIDGTIVNVALPSLVREIGASSTELQWIVDAYTIVFAGFLLIAGNTGDRLGRRRCFVLGLLVFVGGSLGCSLVSTPNQLILLRGVQGLGAAFLMPATLSILTNVFTNPAERARAIGLWAGVSGLGVAIGPLTGGYLLEHFWWGSIFLVNVPIGLVTVVAAVLVVPESRDPHSARLDILGTVFSVVGLISLLFGIIEGPSRGWSDPVVVGSFILAVVTLTAFVLWERHTDHPILDVGFFANPRFTAASIAVTLVFFALFGSLFFVSQYLQFVLGYTALQSGIRLLPVALALMVAAPLSARLVAYFGSKRVVTLGLLLTAGALLLFSRATPTSGYPLIAAVLVIIGVGMGLAIAPATDSIMGSLPPEKAGVGSAMNDTTREIGGALGVAILGSITTAVYTSTITGNAAFAKLKAASPAAARAVQESVGGAAVVAEKLPTAVARTITTAANDAFIHAVDRGVIVGAAVAALGAAVAWFFLPARVHAAQPIDALVDGAAIRLGPEQRRSLAEITLGLLADAGMSSLTYNAVAARSGIGTATLEHYWTSRVDAVSDAMQEVIGEHPIHRTGDLEADLRQYIVEVGDVLANPRARQVLAAVIGEASSDPALATALREHVVAPRRAELAARLSLESDRLRVPLDAAVDQVVGPIYFRTLIGGSKVDDHLVDSIVESVVRSP